MSDHADNADSRIYRTIAAGLPPHDVRQRCNLTADAISVMRWWRLICYFATSIAATITSARCPHGAEVEKMVPHDAGPNGAIGGPPGMQHHALIHA